MTKISSKPFDVQTVKLSGKNLIEASAGTGKTFSVAAMVLRLVLETNLKINEILIVTFTEAAVAELEERVRRFIRNASDYLATNTCTETIVKELVDKTLLENTDNQQIIKQRVSDALVLLDEAQITTIHGFCNNTLKQFAFETQQLFEKELLTDENQLIGKAINDFWRTDITQLPIPILKMLFENNFSRDSLMQSVKKHSDGYRFVSEQVDVEQLALEIETNKNNLLSNKLAAEQYVRDTPNIMDGIKLGSNLRKLLSDSQAFVSTYFDAYRSKNQSAYLLTFPQIFQDFVLLEVQLEQEIKCSVSKIKAHYHSQCIAYTSQKIQAIKKTNSLQSFNDMIQNVHTAVTGESNEKIIKQLKRKYKAVFIDEFQDTDKQQYEIFYEAFANPFFDALEGVYATKVFYIGDPKQSIYAFRQANLITYNQARLSSQNYGMNTNFRSTTAYVQAMNYFFSDPRKNDFFETDKIDYIEVNAKQVSEGKQEDTLNINGLDVKQMSFVHCGHKDSKEHALANEVLKLLQTAKINGHPVKPSDIGILVSSNENAKKLKIALAKNGIPSVVVDDSKVLESDENTLIRYLLLTILEPNRSNLNRLLLTHFTHFTEQELEQLDVAAELIRFNRIITDYQQFGVYTALMSFIKIYDSSAALQKNIFYLASRKLSNYSQLAEICKERELRFSPDLLSLVSWLKKSNESVNDPSDSYIQRLESDEESLNILTIHKSKGLQYKIVLIDFPEKGHKSKELIDYQNKDGEFEFCIDSGDEQLQEILKIQQNQETKRLWYVAITRAELKTYVFCKTIKDEKKEACFITEYTKKLSKETFFDAYFEFLEADFREYPKYFTPNIPNIQAVLQPNASIDFKALWSVSSYTSMSKKQENHLPKTILDGLDDYNEFVFHKLPRGKHFGTFMHHIFEEIDFCKPQSIKEYLVRKVNSPLSKNILTEKNLDYFYGFVQQVLTCKLIDDLGKTFELDKISLKLPELEFYFSIDELDAQDLERNFEQPVLLQDACYNGFIMGFVDLCFEFEGKYYILDWKSNHLGDDLEAYNQQNLQLAMNANNYHLQYFIYSIALCRQLQLIHSNFDYDKDFGGVFYVFVRACRAGENTGIFYHKPSFESIKNYL